MRVRSISIGLRQLGAAVVVLLAVGGLSFGAQLAASRYTSDVAALASRIASLEAQTTAAQNLPAAPGPSQQTRR